MGMFQDFDPGQHRDLNTQSLPPQFLCSRISLLRRNFSEIVDLVHFGYICCFDLVRYKTARVTIISKSHANDLYHLSRSDLKNLQSALTWYEQGAFQGNNTHHITEILQLYRESKKKELSL